MSLVRACLSCVSDSLRACHTVLVLAGLTLLLAGLHIDGLLVGWSWTTVLAPFFVLCCLPVAAPVVGCLGVRFVSQPSCGHI